MWKLTKDAACDPGVMGRERWSPRQKWVVWKWIERAIFTVGLSLLALYGTVRLEGCLSSRAALESFAALESSAPAAPTGLRGDSSSPEADFGSWSENRVRAYQESLSNQFGAPIAVLQIPKIHLAVPLLDGTDALTLNHAVGRIAGTARPGEQGNIGIAGHRDGFFRGLKDLKPGDLIELRTTEGTGKYVVDQIQIVTPDKVSVLRPRPVSSLTLVTCYPFYFFGSAPKRFVVTASLTQRQPAGSATSETQLNSQTRSSTQEEQ